MTCLEAAIHIALLIGLLDLQNRWLTWLNGAAAMRVGGGAQFPLCCFGTTLSRLNAEARNSSKKESISHPHSGGEDIGELYLLLLLLFFSMDLTGLLAPSTVGKRCTYPFLLTRPLHARIQSHVLLPVHREPPVCSFPAPFSPSVESYLLSLPSGAPSIHVTERQKRSCFKKKNQKIFIKDISTFLSFFFCSCVFATPSFSSSPFLDDAYQVLIDFFTAQVNYLGPN